MLFAPHNSQGPIILKKKGRGGGNTFKTVKSAELDNPHSAKLVFFSPQLLLFYTVRHAELAPKRSRLFLQPPLLSFKKQYQTKPNQLAQMWFRKETV